MQPPSSLAIHPNCPRRRPRSGTALLSVLNGDARASARNVRHARGLVKTLRAFRPWGRTFASYHIPLPKLDGFYQAMQNPGSYYAVPKYDGRVWSDWRQSGSSSWASSSAMTLKEVPRYPDTFHDPAHSSAIPISYTLTPPTPDSTDSDVSSSSSQLSMESIPELDDIPEIPFVSASVAYADADGWITSDRPAEQARIDDSSETSSFWSSIIGLRPSASKSSSNASSPVLGHTTARSLSPTRGSRKRAGSLSSIASSRTKPAPAKSILSSADSVKTRRRKAPSVKFLDMPTIHYDDDYPCHDEDEDDGDQLLGARVRSPDSPPPKKKARGLGGFLSFRWLFGGPPKDGQQQQQQQQHRAGAPARPAISGPYPLWDSPSRRACSNGAAASLRSVKSSGSLRSVRSCGSRLPTYWPR